MTQQAINLADVNASWMMVPRTCRRSMKSPPQELDAPSVHLHSDAAKQPSLMAVAMLSIA